MNIIPISFRERFFGLPNSLTGGLYAPSTLGAPVFTNPVNHSTFKSTKEEKLEKTLIKKEHKKKLVEYYGKGNVGKRLNIKSE